MRNQVGHVAVFWYRGPHSCQVQHLHQWADFGKGNGGFLGVISPHLVIVLEDYHREPLELLRVLLPPLPRSRSILAGDGVIPKFMKGITVFFAHTHTHNAGQVPGHVEAMRNPFSVILPAALAVRVPPGKVFVTVSELLCAGRIGIRCHYMGALFLMLKQVFDLYPQSGCDRLHGASSVAFQKHLSVFPLGDGKALPLVIMGRAAGRPLSAAAIHALQPR